MRERETFYIDREALKELKALSRATRINRSTFIREGVAAILKKYSKELAKAKRKR